MLIQYPSHNNKIPSYMDHALYRLDKTKIVFENYYLIDAKLFQPTFNYPKFFTITHFVKCIKNYKSAINYDMAYSNIAHKYFLRPFMDGLIRRSTSRRF